jgi:hypothetical protein
MNNSPEFMATTERGSAERVIPPRYGPEGVTERVPEGQRRNKRHQYSRKEPTGLG